MQQRRARRTRWERPRARLGKGLLGGLYGRELPEDLVGACELDDDLNRTRDIGERDFSVVRGNFAVKREDGAEARRVEHLRVRKVENKIANAVLHVILEGILEFVGVAEVESFAHMHDDRIWRERFHVKAHGHEQDAWKGKKYKKEERKERRG